MVSKEFWIQEEMKPELIPGFYRKAGIFFWENRKDSIICDVAKKERLKERKKSNKRAQRIRKSKMASILKS